MRFVIWSDRDWARPRRVIRMRHLCDILPVLSPQEGYDRAATIYDRWHWTEFWRRNERPIVAAWLHGLVPGLALDAGSGTGNYRSELEARGHICIAVDLSLEMLRVQGRKNKHHHGMTRCDLSQGDLRCLPFTSSIFDHVLCTRVLSHIERLEAALSELARVVRPKGSLLLTDVHPSHPYEHVTIRNSFRVAIQIHKHAITDLIDAATASGRFRMLWIREYCLQDLAWKPPPQRFQKIYDSPNTPIFYVCSLQRV